jgi:23S rRNA (uridine2552-2'-O)-methyltransferase
MDYKRPDAWTRKAKAEGYAARSVYKLDEIDRRHQILPRGVGTAIDLGCYPGSWSRWLLQKRVRVVGVDLKAPELDGGTWIARSIYEVEAAELLEAAGGHVQLFVSDMAPNTTGNRLGDHVRQIELADRALDLARACLLADGVFVVKVFDGEDAPAYVNRVRAVFREVKRLKPDATRDRSVEFFLVGKGLKASGG